MHLDSAVEVNKGPVEESIFTEKVEHREVRRGSVHVSAIFSGILSSKGIFLRN